MNDYNKTKMISSHGFINNIAVIRPQAISPYSKDKSIIFNQLHKSDLILCNKGPLVLYLHVDSIPLYFLELKNIKSPFVLLCGDTDIEVRNEDINTSFIKILLHHPFLKRLYCQNWGSKPHPKVVCLPIGLDFHTLNKNLLFTFQHNQHNWGNYASPFIQEKQIMNIKKPKIRRTLCYVNFIHSKDLSDRNEALNNLPKDLLYIESNHLTRVETLKNMATFKYVISPHGHGLDCHRTWEALCLGCIPIVKKSSLSENDLYSNLPVIVVNKWSDVTKDLLNNNSIKSLNSLHPKLTLNYWKQKIYSEFN